MSTIFGAPWSELRFEHVEAYLEQADDEPLLWEAKGTKLDPKEVRRQVCAFANGHEVGYLILGADRDSAEPDAPKWRVDGVEFPDEPRTWIAEVIGHPEGGVRPRPDFDVAAWPAANGHVAVVRVTPTSTPPCIANGTVYERLPGKTQTVRDPLILAGLFSRGDEARKRAQALADRAARTVMDALAGEAGSFRRPWTPIETEDQPADDDTTDDETTHVRFAVGVAATGIPPNIAGRLFRDEFAEKIWTQLRDRPTGLPPGFGRPPDSVDVSQEALTWRHELLGHVDSITVVRAAWDGSAGAGQKLATEDVYPDSLAQQQIAPQWRLADQLVQRLGGFGDVYIAALVEGGRFPRRKDPVTIVMRRGPVLPGVDDEHVASLGRELMRALGNLAQEP
jgi:Putative DNA-binding domain